MCFSYKNKHRFIASHPSAFAEARAPSSLERSVTRRQANTQRKKSVDQRRAEEEKEEEEDNQSAIAATAMACVLRRAPRHCARTGVFLNPGLITAGYMMGQVQVRPCPPFLPFFFLFLLPHQNSNFFLDLYLPFLFQILDLGSSLNW